MTVFTDNKNILYDTSIKNSRLQRWRIMLSEFNLQIEHIKGNDNYIPDLISRAETIVKTESTSSLVKEELSKCKPPNEYEILKYKLTEFPNFKLYVDDKKRIFLNKDDGKYFCKKIHMHYGHAGLYCLYLTIKEYFLIPNIKKILNDVVKSCDQCVLNKINKHKYGLITGNLSTLNINEKLYIDHLGPFVKTKINIKSKVKKFWLLVVTEAYSKFTKIYLVKDLSPETTTKKLNKYFENFGRPKYIVSDNARTFIGKQFKEFLRTKEVKHLQILPYNPESNGLVERRNRVILEVFKIYDLNTISSYIEKAELKLNKLLMYLQGMHQHNYILRKMILTF